MMMRARNFFIPSSQNKIFSQRIRTSYRYYLLRAPKLMNCNITLFITVLTPRLPWCQKTASINVRHRQQKIDRTLNGTSFV
jgi:hypothetical protein